jgi:hypothetical protein
LVSGETGTGQQSQEAQKSPTALQGLEGTNRAIAIEVADALGASIGVCLIWWPISFLAVKGALGLHYRWRPFLFGYALATVATAVLHLMAGPLATVMDHWFDLGTIMVFPLIGGVGVAFALADRFEDEREQEAEPPPSRLQELASFVEGARRQFLTNPGPWICGASGALIVLAITFAPWVQPLPRMGVAKSIGLGTFFRPPHDVPHNEYAHIDYGRLAFEIVLLVVGAGLAWLAVNAFLSRQRSARIERSPPLHDQIQDVAGRAVVYGYRKIAAERGCAPTSKTSDAEILDIYKRVLTAFRAAAEKRGERIPAGNLNFMAWKFFLVKEKFGEEFMQEHLNYEVDKYVSEGLRSDYQQELNLI